MHLPTVLSRLSVSSTSLTQPALPLIHKAKKSRCSITLTTLAALCFSFSSSLFSTHAVANSGTLSDFPTRSTYSAGTTSSFSGYAADGGSDVIYLNVTMPATLSTGKTMLFESGGGLYGITVYYEGNSFKVSLGEGNVVDLEIDNTFVAGQRYTLFIEINRSPNTVEAYVAPQTDTDLPGQVSSIGSSSWTGPNWSGSNGAGWGVKHSAIQGVAGPSNEVNSFANFDGSFHEGRFYSQTTFAEVWEDGQNPSENISNDSLNIREIQMPTTSSIVSQLLKDNANYAKIELSIEPLGLGATDGKGIDIFDASGKRVYFSIAENGHSAILYAYNQGGITNTGEVASYDGTPIQVGQQYYFTLYIEPSGIYVYHSEGGALQEALQYEDSFIAPFRYELVTQRTGAIYRHIQISNLD